METKCSVVKGKFFVNRLGFKHVDGVDSSGLSGGFLVGWDDNVVVNILYANKNMVHVYMVCICHGLRVSPSKLSSDSLPTAQGHASHVIMGLVLFATCLYGNPELHLRDEVWHQLRGIHDQMGPNGKWVVFGDFNQIISSNDKVSFRNMEVRGAQQLIDCINYCESIEMPPKGQYLTLTNNRIGENVLWERLDRACMNCAWMNHFTKACFTNLPIMDSKNGGRKI